MLELDEPKDLASAFSRGISALRSKPGDAIVLQQEAFCRFEGML